MKIGIKFDDARFDNLDMIRPQDGNPGIGGTAYEEILLAKLLGDTEHIVVLYHTNSTNKLPANIVDRQVKQISEIPQAAFEDNIDILIFSAGRSDAWYDELEKRQVKSIAWAHCYLNYFELRKIRNTRCVKRVVFVGKEQYSTYIADDIIGKAAFIFNIFQPEDKYREHLSNRNKQVVYLGSLYKRKGFHILAKAWKEVIENEPDAKLVVLGNGKLYGRNMRVGKYGLARASYEKQFIKYITDEKGKILESVDFKGIVGKEKSDIILNSAVGVVNPSGLTETFCISAVEIEGCAVPVCTTGRYGLLDTVVDKETGMFSYNSRQLAKNVLFLLNNTNLNIKIGKKGRKYVQKFDGRHIIPQWLKIFEEIKTGQAAIYIEPSRKSIETKIKKMIRKLRIDDGHKWIPSFIFFEFLFKGLSREWARDILRYYILKQKMVND